MTDTTQNLCMHYVPTLAERFWRKLGYRYHLGEEPEGTDGMPGWMMHGVRLHFGFADRLRLLLGTGRNRPLATENYATQSVSLRPFIGGQSKMHFEKNSSPETLPISVNIHVAAS